MFKKVDNDSVRIDFIHDTRHLCTRFWMIVEKECHVVLQGTNK